MKCPGQDMQFWEADAIYEVKCPQCETMVEFYKDDTTRKCHQCGHRFVNPKMDFGCATYCQFAEQCLGTLPEDFVLNKDSFLKDKVAVAVKRYFKKDFTAIRKTLQIADYAEKIGKDTDGANLPIILCSAFLFYILVPLEKQITESNAGLIPDDDHLQAAEEILFDAGAQKQLIDQVFEIYGKGSELSEDGTTARSIIFDAHHLALLDEQKKKQNLNESSLTTAISKMCTEPGRKMAEKLRGDL